MEPELGASLRERSAVATLLGDALADPSTTWSLGSFGAVAAFLRDPDEPSLALPDHRLGLATARGAIAFGSIGELRPVAYETGFASGWNHAVALCLPRDSCAMNRRTVLTELGPDRDAARIEDRDGILFDLGLGLLAVDACIRAHDPETIALLRGRTGARVFDPGDPVGPSLLAAGPHRVFLTRIGRIEVFSPVQPNSSGVACPQSYIVADILRSGRTHAATAPIPPGWVPCGAFQPPHPCKDASGRRIPFRRDRHDAFQALLERWGDPALLAAKSGRPGDGGALGRHARSARRAAEAQAPYLQVETVR